MTLAVAMRSIRPALVLVLVLAFHGRARAQDEGEARTFVAAWASTLAESLAPRWTGPRVPWPEPSPRPAAWGLRSSSFHPVSVHAATHRVTPELEAEALEALETAHDWLEQHRWVPPPPDGGLGGTAGFDLYFVAPVRASVDALEAEESDPLPDAPWHAAGRVDSPLLWDGLDAAVTHAVLPVDIEPDRVSACVISAYVQAAVLARDPAEAVSWRISTGDFVAYLITGRFGCSDDVVAQQHRPERGWITREPHGGGALLLTMLSARVDGLTGELVRELWEGGRQLTWEGAGLRAAPDLWQLLNRRLEVDPPALPFHIEELGVSRFFSGPPERRRGASTPPLADLPPEAAVPLFAHTRWERLPRRFEPRELELEAHGSAYALVDTRRAPPGSTLKIWLRGEYGVAWALSAVRLTADGRERGRVRAPPRERTPSSYVPVELVDGETSHVLIAITNLGYRLVDADESDAQVLAFRVIVDAEPSPSVDGDQPGEDEADSSPSPEAP